MTTPIRRYCCHLMCSNLATVELTIGPRPFGYTDSCDLHKEDLVGADEKLLYETPIGPSKEPLCDRAPDGWRCYLEAGHDGPCPAWPEAGTGPLRAELRTLPADRIQLARVPVNPEYRPSKWSTPWALLLGLIGYELWAVATSKPGGPLSHLVWWTYGDRWSLRWWLCSMGMNGLGLWAAAHFMFEWPEVRELGITVAVMLAMGVVGWWITR